MKLACFAVTAKGARLAVQLAASLAGDDVRVYAKHAPPEIADRCLPLGSLAESVGQRFADCDGLVFFMALGIVVRLVGPLAADKRRDPAVVAVDDGGQFAISVLAGHIGGANELARRTASCLQALPVITTATDVAGAAAADVLATRLGLRMEPFGQMKYVNAALAAGEKVSFLLDQEVPDAALWRRRAAEAGVALEPLDAWPGGTEPLVVLSDRLWPSLAAHAAPVLYLRPPSLFVGMGCRRGAPPAAVRRALETVLAARGLALSSVAGLGSAWVKAAEPALVALARELDVPFVCYGREQLQRIVQEQGLEQSEFVYQQIGVGNVCEAAAWLQRSPDKGRLIIPKSKCGPVTVAVVRGALQ